MYFRNRSERDGTVVADGQLLEPADLESVRPSERLFAAQRVRSGAGERKLHPAEPLTTRSEAVLVVTIRCYRQDPDRCDRATYGIGLMLDKKAELNASTNYRWTQPCE